MTTRMGANGTNGRNLAQQAAGFEQLIGYRRSKIRNAQLGKRELRNHRLRKSHILLAAILLPIPLITKSAKAQSTWSGSRTSTLA